jgi:tetratricopeptide (TPR) repeat protein
VREKAPFLLLALGSCLVTLAAQAPGVKVVPLELRLENALLAHAEYLHKVIDPRELSAIYPYPETISARALLVAAVAVGGVTALALAQARRRPWLSVGWLWFVGMLVPTLGLVQVGVQAFADRYTYLPFLGLALAASFALGELAERARFGRALAIGAAGLSLAALTIQTRTQVPFWRDTISVFTHAIEVTRSNWFAHTELGIAWLTRGELEPAREELEAALRIRPDHPRALANLGLVETRLGAPADGAVLLERALALDPSLEGGHLALGLALERAGRIAEAGSAYRAAIDDPRGAREARLRLARLLSVSPDAAFRNGAAAMALCDAACRESPCDSPEELDVCAMASMEGGRRDDAVAQARRAVERARARGDSELAVKIEQRLAGYLEGRPVRLSGVAP